MLIKKKQKMTKVYMKKLILFWQIFVFDISLGIRFKSKRIKICRTAME